MDVKIFLFGDAVYCAKQGQSVPQGYYNIENMLKIILNHQAEVGLCSSCMNAHGMKDEEMIEGAKRSSMDELADWTIWADKVIVF